MSSRLFRSVVVASTLLLSSAGAGGCAASVGRPDGALDEDAASGVPDAGPAASDAAVDAVAPHDTVHVDVSVADAAVADAAVADAAVADAAVDVVSADEPLFEPGWPTTKGWVCTFEHENVGPDARPLHCCWSGGEPFGCCAVSDDGRDCTPCVLDEESGRCVRSSDAGGDAGGAVDAAGADR